MSAVQELTLGGPVDVRAAVHHPDGEPAGPFFFLTHGAGGDLHTPGLVALAELVAANGHLSIRADLPYRAAGRKTPPAAEKSVDGFRASFDQARDKFGPDRSWVVGGRSYGGRVASMAVAAGLEAAGILLYSYPLHRPGDSSVPRVTHWPDIRVPVLFLEGSDDPFCDLGLLRTLLPELGGRPTLHVVQGAGHSLKVPATRSPDGRARSERSVVAGLGPQIESWIEGLGQAP